MYEAIGMAIAAIIRLFFWVPHRFRYGLLVAGGWGNYGDIRTSLRHALTLLLMIRSRYSNFRYHEHLRCSALQSVYGR